MDGTGAVDYDGAARLAEYLVTDMRNDGLVISGTTGESPTTSDDEKARLLATVLEAVGDRATVVAGVGTNDTAHTLRARQRGRGSGRARAPGRHAVLQQAAAERAGRALHAGRRRHRPARHALRHSRPHRHRDRDGDPAQARRAPADHRGQGRQGRLRRSLPTSWQRTSLAFYSGDDMVNLPWLSLGAAGFVSVVGHVVGDRLHDMIDAYRSRADMPMRCASTGSCCRSTPACSAPRA